MDIWPPALLVCTLEYTLSVKAGVTLKNSFAKIKGGGGGGPRQHFWEDRF